MGAQHSDLLQAVGERAYIVLFLKGTSGPTGGDSPESEESKGGKWGSVFVSPEHWRPPWEQQPPQPSPLLRLPPGNRFNKVTFIGAVPAVPTALSTRVQVMLLTAVPVLSQLIGGEGAC